VIAAGVSVAVGWGPGGPPRGKAASRPNSSALTTMTSSAAAMAAYDRALRTLLSGVGARHGDGVGAPERAASGEGSESAGKGAMGDIGLIGRAPSRGATDRALSTLGTSDGWDGPGTASEQRADVLRLGQCLPAGGARHEVPLDRGALDLGELPRHIGGELLFDMRVRPHYRAASLSNAV
jgi:hypothetical protein